MLEHILVSSNFIHISALCYCAAFLSRDQILLRALVITGDLVEVTYLYFAPDIPLWGGIFWDIVLVSINVTMIVRIFLDRKHSVLSEEEQHLYRFFDSLSPGEFRRLLKIARWHHAEMPETLATQDEPLDHLYFVLDGIIIVEKSGNSLIVAPEIFIGEVAFLLTRPATATVTVAKGGRYLSWDTSALRHLVLRAPSLGVALSSTLNRDMAAKVARS